MAGAQTVIKKGQFMILAEPISDSSVAEENKHFNQSMSIKPIEFYRKLFKEKKLEIIYEE